MDQHVSDVNFNIYEPESLNTQNKDFNIHDYQEKFSSSKSKSHPNKIKFLTSVNEALQDTTAKTAAQRVEKEKLELHNIDLQNKIQAYEMEISDLTSILSDTENTTRNLSSTLQATKLENISMKKKLDRSETAPLYQGEDSSKEMEQDLRRKLQIAEIEIKKLKLLNNGFQQQFIDLDNTKENEETKYRGKIAQLQDTLKKSEETIGAQTDEMEALIEQNSQMSQLQTDLQNNLIQMQKQLHDSKTCTISAEEEYNSQIKLLNEKHEIAMNSMKEKIDANCKSLSKRFEADIKILEKKYEQDLKNQADKYAQDATSIKDKNQEQIDSLSKIHQVHIKGLDEQYENHKKMNQLDNEKQICKLHEEHEKHIANLNMELKKMKNTQLDLEDENSKLNNSLLKTESRYNTLNDMSSKYSQEEMKFKVELDIERNNMKKLETNLQQANKHNEHLTLEQQLLEKDIYEYKTKCNSIQEKHDISVETIHQYSNENQTMKEKIITLENQLKELESKQTQLNQDLSCEKSKYESTKSNLNISQHDLTLRTNENGNLKNEVNQLSAEIKQIQIEFNNCQTMKSAADNQLCICKIEGDNLKEKNQNLQNIINQMETDISNMKKNHHDHLISIENLESEIRISQVTKTNFEKQIESFTGTNDELAKKLETYTKSDLQMKQDIIILEQKLKNMEEIASQLHKTKCELRDTSMKLEKAENQLKAAQNESRDTSMKLEKAENQLKAAQNESRDTSMKLEKAENQLKAAQNESRETITQLEKAENQLKAAQNESLDTSMKLEKAENQLKAAQNESRETSTQLEKAENQVKAAQSELQSKEMILNANQTAQKNIENSITLLTEEKHVCDNEILKLRESNKLMNDQVQQSQSVQLQLTSMNETYANLQTKFNILQNSYADIEKHNFSSNQTNEKLEIKYSDTLKSYADLDKKYKECQELQTELQEKLQQERLLNEKKNDEMDYLLSTLEDQCTFNDYTKGHERERNKTLKLRNTKIERPSIYHTYPRNAKLYSSSSSSCGSRRWQGKSKTKREKKYDVEKCLRNSHKSYEKKKFDEYVHMNFERQREVADRIDVLQKDSDNYKILLPKMENLILYSKKITKQTEMIIDQSNTLKKKLAQKDEDLSVLHMQYESVKTIQHELETKLSASCADKTQIEYSLHTSMIKCKDLEHEIEKYILEKPTMNNELQMHRERVEQLNNEISQQKSKCDILNSELNACRNEMTGIKVELHDYKEKYRKMQMTVTDENNKYSNCEKELRKITENNIKLTNELRKAEDTIKSSSENYATLDTKFNDLDRMYMACKEKNIVLSTEKQLNSITIQDLNETRNTVNEEKIFIENEKKIVENEKMMLKNDRKILQDKLDKYSIFHNHVDTDLYADLKQNHANSTDKSVINISTLQNFTKQVKKILAVELECLKKWDAEINSKTDNNMNFTNEKSNCNKSISQSLNVISQQLGELLHKNHMHHAETYPKCNIKLTPLKRHNDNRRKYDLNQRCIPAQTAEFSGNLQTMPTTVRNSNGTEFHGNAQLRIKKS